MQKPKPRGQRESPKAPDYLASAPVALVEMHRSGSFVGRHILSNLLCDSRMKGVWRELAKHIEGRSEWEKLWREIQTALARRQPLPTRGEERRHFSNVAAQARELITLLDERPVGHHSLAATTMLERVADDADQRAREVRLERRLVDRWRGPKLSFIRGITGYFERELGARLYGSVATIATVALELEVTKGDVEKAMKSQ